MADSKSIKMYEDLCEMLEDELNDIVKKREVTQENLDWIDKLSHSIKSIKTTVAMIKAEEEGYGNSFNSYDRGYSTARGGSYDYSRGSYEDGMSNRDSYDYNRDYSRDYSRDGSYDGSYARRGRDGDGDGRYNESRGRYSRDTSKDQMIQKLEHMMNDTMDKQDKQAIQNLIHQMRQ